MSFQRILSPIVASVGGLLIMLVVVTAFGYAPLAVMRGFATATVGSPDRIAATLLVGCPLILASLGVCIAFRCGVWNIGAEGQYLVGALAAAWLGIHVATWPAWLGVPSVLVAGALAGAAWAGLAAA